jgi:hypothetical protein
MFDMQSIMYIAIFIGM